MVLYGMCVSFLHTLPVIKYLITFQIFYICKYMYYGIETGDVRDG